MLTEERLSGKSKAFRCPRAVYDAVVEVLSKADRPLLLDEIATGAEKELGDRPADHQVRVALRFWMHLQKPLLTRSRARHRPTSLKDFGDEADRRWLQLRR